MSLVNAQALKVRIEENMESFKLYISTLDKDEIIESVQKIANMEDTYNRLLNQVDLDDESIAYLLQFEIPLGVVAAEWEIWKEFDNDFGACVFEMIGDEELLEMYPLAPNTDEAYGENEEVPECPFAEMCGALNDVFDSVANLHRVLNQNHN